MRIDLTKLVTCAVLVLAAFGIVACDATPAPRAVPTFAPRPTATPTLAVAKGGMTRVTRGSLTQAVMARGRVNSVREAFLFFNIAGTLSNIVVAAGDQVKQGAPIGQLDAFQLEQDLNLARYEADRTSLILQQAQARLGAFDYRIETSNNAYTRTLDLRNQLFQMYRLKAPTPADHARAITEYNQYLNAEADLQRIMTDLNNYKTDRQITVLDIDLNQKLLAYNQRRVEAVQTRLNNAKLVAPFNGLVVSVDKSVGDSVQAFEPIGALADPTQLQIEVSVSESDVLSVSLGQPTRIVLDGFADKVFTGKVKEIASKEAIFQGKNVYRVLVAFDNQTQVPATIRTGADVSFVLQAKENVLLVPSNAVQLDGATQYVNILRDGKAERVPVQVGANGNNQTEIISGLNEGEQVLLP